MCSMFSFRYRYTYIDWWVYLRVGVRVTCHLLVLPLLIARRELNLYYAVYALSGLMA